jgi:hypothetical protein
LENFGRLVLLLKSNEEEALCTCTSRETSIEDTFCSEDKERGDWRGRIESLVVDDVGFPKDKLT